MKEASPPTVVRPIHPPPSSCSFARSRVYSLFFRPCLIFPFGSPPPPSSLPLADSSIGIPKGTRAGHSSSHCRVYECLPATSGHLFRQLCSTPRMLALMLQLMLQYPRCAYSRLLAFLGRELLKSIKSCLSTFSNMIELSLILQELEYCSISVLPYPSLYIFYTIYKVLVKNSLIYFLLLPFRMHWIIKKKKYYI